MRDNMTTGAVDFTLGGAVMQRRDVEQSIDRHLIYTMYHVCLVMLKYRYTEKLLQSLVDVTDTTRTASTMVVFMRDLPDGMDPVEEVVKFLKNTKRGR